MTQAQLARVLKVSVPLISSYESTTNPRIPPLPRVDLCARFFASLRSFESDPPAALGEADLTGDEKRVYEDLKNELRRLRNDALRARVTDPQTIRSAAGALKPSPWHFADGNPVTIVCAEWPQDMLAQMPYTDINEPDYIELLKFSDLDALFELHGHLRASNPTTQIRVKAPHNLSSDDHHSHVVVIGGVDWNKITSASLNRLQLPVRQVANWERPDGQYFEVDDNGSSRRYMPVLNRAGDQVTLDEDVALFARAPSPFDRRRTISICNGMYGRGTYGVVRALTDESIRDRNAEWLQSRFGDGNCYCILSRIQTLNGATLTPDWELGEDVHFTWSR